MKTLRPHFKLIIPSTLATLVATILILPMSAFAQAPTPQNPQGGSVGVEGTISSPPPTTGASISLPSTNQSYTSTPINVSGLCPDGLLVKLFKNNVFSGSAICNGGSYSISTDLFSGQNELIARVYDALDQAGPDSNLVTVQFNDSRPSTGPRVSLTSNFAKRGATPGDIFSWPIVLSGGNGPYAISADWGDGQPAQIISRSFPSEFQLEHSYETAGVYNIIIKAIDKDGVAAFLQLVGIGNGPLGQEVKSGAAAESIATKVRVRVVYWPILVFFPLIFSTFWLGRRYELLRLRRRAERGLI